MAALEAGRDVLFDIDWQGATSIADKAPADSVRVFILPPTMADLRRRLVARAQDSDLVIERRLERAAGEVGREATYEEVKGLRRESLALKEAVANHTLENRLLKKA